MGGKNLVQKLKTGMVGLGIIGASYFNANAQENYQPKYNTTTHYIIKEIQKENSFVNAKTLDEIINQSKTIITKKNYSEQEAKDLMKKINSEIIEKYPELKKFPECFNRSLTYLAIGEVNNLPLYIVAVPEHMFVRWDPDRKHKCLETSFENLSMFVLFSGKLPRKFSEEERIEAEKLNKGDFNWDPTFLKFKKDGEYFMQSPVPFEDLNKKWLKNLTKKELLAQIYKQEAVLLENSEKYQRALEHINKSLDLDTLKWEIYTVKGSILSKIGEKECGGKELSQKCEQLFLESNKNYEEAIKMANSKDLSDLGKNFYFLKDYQKSEECFNKTLEVFKNDALLHLKRAKFYHLIGQKEKAIKDLLAAYNINGEKIVKFENNFGHLKFADDIIRLNKNKIYFKSVMGKEILEWNEAKKACDVPNEYLRRMGFKDFWRLSSLEELKTIDSTYKNIKVRTNIWSNPPVEYPKNKWYWSSDSDSLEAFVKSFKEGSIKKIKKNPHYWKLEDVEIYQDISCVCIMDLDENKTNKLLNVLEKLSWNEQKFYHAINKD